jgi:hypothetical protein
MFERGGGGGKCSGANSVISAGPTQTLIPKP